MRNSFPRDRRQAFTLIEIIVALTIIAVIAAVAIPTIKGIREEEKARQPVTAMADLVQEVRQRAMQERRPYQIVFEREGVHACADSFPFSKREDFLKYLEDQRQPPEDNGFLRQEPERLTGGPTELARAAAAAGFANSMNTAGLGGGAGAFSAGSMGGASAAYPRPITPEDPVISYEEYSAAQSRERDKAREDQAVVEDSASLTPAEPAAPTTDGPWIVSIPLPEKTACEVLLWGDGEWEEIEGDKIRRWVFQPSGVTSPARIRLRSEQTEMEASFDPITGEISSEKSRLLTMWP